LATEFSPTGKKVYFYFFYVKMQLQLLLNEERDNEDRDFLGEFKNFVQSNQVEQGQGDSYDVHYSNWHYGSCGHTYCN
jgi:hypothetical protein